MASAMLSKLTGLPALGKALRKASTYSGMLPRVCSTNCGVLCISTLFWIGPLACSPRSPWHTIPELRGIEHGVEDRRVNCVAPSASRDRPTSVRCRRRRCRRCRRCGRCCSLSTWLRDGRGSKNSFLPSSRCCSLMGWPRSSANCCDRACAAASCSTCHNVGTGGTGSADNTRVGRSRLAEETRSYRLISWRCYHAHSGDGKRT